MVGDIGGGAEEGVGGGDVALVLFAAADEEQDVTAALGVLAVAAAGRGVLAGGALGLSVKKIR